MALDGLPGAESGGVAWAAAAGATIPISSGVVGRPPTILPMPATVTALSRFSVTDVLAGDTEGTAARPARASASHWRLTD